MVVQVFIGEVVGDDEGAHGPPLVQVFVPVGHHALLDHPGHGGADLLGVDAQVVAVHQLEPDGIGDAAETQLDAVAIVDHLGGVTGHGLLRLSDGGILELIQGEVGLDDHIGHGHRQGAVSRQVGDMRVDLIDDLVGGVEGLHLPLQVAGYAAVAVLVHGGDAHHCHVGPLAAVELLAVVVQVDGEVAAHPGGVDLPEVGVVEEGLVVELVLQGGVGVDGILGAPPGHAGPQLHRVLGVDAVGNPVEVAQEEPGLAGVDGPDDAVSAVDEADGVLHGAQLALVDLLVGHALVFVAEVLLVLSVLFQHHIGDIPVVVFVVFVHTDVLLFLLRSPAKGPEFLVPL